MLTFEQGFPRDTRPNHEKSSPLPYFCGTEEVMDGIAHNSDTSTDGAYANLRQEWNYSLSEYGWFADVPTWGARGLYVGRTKHEARRTMQKGAGPLSEGGETHAPRPKYPPDFTGD